MAREHLLRVDRRPGSAEKRPVGMPKCMPADASEALFRSEPVTRVVDGNGVSFHPTSFGIFASYSRISVAFRTGEQTPTGAANIVLLDPGLPV